jgi:hypothetical protein
MSIKTPKPRAGSTGRKTRNVSTSAFGTPGPRKHAEGRATTKATPQYPKGSVALTPKVEKGPRRSPGSPYDTKLVNRQVQGPTVREGGGSGKPAGSTASPFRAKGGNGPGNSTKNPKTN